jgi:hypothetical protein
VNASPPPAETTPGLEELRALLLGDERERVERLERLILERSERTSLVADVLVEALLERAGRDTDLARALRVVVEETLRLSVKKTPVTLAETLFPVFGPAIRRTITHALGAATESLSRTIDQTLTPRAIGWRLEAMRTGRSFGEIVLLRTLEYRVEQAYLIHRETGLLLLHEGSSGTSAPDAGLVSGMLTAIRDFARDSFDAQDDLERFQLGELTVYVESGPMAVIAVVVRGTTPPDLHERLAGALEGVHRRFADDLRDYNGDPAAFEIARDDLNELLVASYRGAPKPQPRAAPKPRPAWRRPVVWGLAALLVFGIAWLEVTRRENARWGAFFETLRAQPGIVVTHVAHRDGTWVVEGLRDPFAPSLETLLEGSGLPATGVRSVLRPFVSLEPAFVLRRATDALQPPASVQLRLENGILYAEGRATPMWLARARNLVPALPGIARFAVDELQVSQAESGRP